MSYQQQLNYQADRIEMVLASYRVPGRISGGLVTPRLIRFHFIPALGTKLARLKALSEELALSLGVPSCLISRHAGSIQIDIPRPNRIPVRLLHLATSLPTPPPCSPLLGLDQDGFPLLLSLPSANVSHVLIAGTTGSGKTSLARTMISSLAIHNLQAMLQLALVDLKGRGFAPFHGLPHLLAPIAQRPAEAVALLRHLVKEMERRDDLRIASPRLVLFIDELAELMMLGGSEVEALLTRLMQRGREAGVHLVACTQKPLATVIGSLVKANFPARIVGKVASGDDARVAAGIAGTGAEQLSGPGDFLVIVGGSQVRLQAAWIGEEEIRRVVQLLQEGKLRRRRWEEKWEGETPSLGQRVWKALGRGKE